MAELEYGDNQALVELLRETRLKKKIGLRELARRANYPASNLCSIEKGRVHLSSGVARQLFKAMGMNIRVVVEQDLPPVKLF